ncbi:helix-turn-helix transcriptional regulator [Dactylosporangium sp. NPDC005572]|uniref:helix-turn-helix domain-containing protein n=1 Tax=Dactylosporangium sp. NPDC005572 TaxID=3156889 RepID=UPI0033ACD06F
MDFDEWAIGQRIAQYRQRRGLTQDELAGLVGISLSMMKKIEAGTRTVTRFSQLVLFAQILRVSDLRDLTGVPMSLMPDGRRGHPAADAVRMTVLERGHGAEPVGLERLRRLAQRAWGTWQEPSTFRYDAVGQYLTEVIGLAQAQVETSTGEERRQALAVASSVYQLARTWTKRVGEYDLSWVVADRAVACAIDADDPDLTAAAAWNLAMILSAQGKTTQARSVVRQAISELGQLLGDQPAPARLAAYGGLHLLGATEAAREDDARDAWNLLDTAATIAARTGETNHHRMVFGPTNVVLHRISTAIELGRTREAVELIERTDARDAASVERRLTFHIDAARCYTRRDNVVAAVHMMGRVLHDSRDELRYNLIARETLRQLGARCTPSIRADLDPLLEAAGLTP